MVKLSAFVFYPLTSQNLKPALTAVVLFLPNSGSVVYLWYKKNSTLETCNKCNAPLKSQHYFKTHDNSS